ncbi:MAG TPA: DNA repair protein RecO [Feifaniaceae bacterium]|nr:DNA repair protein RecO [Feifaniaceae bacterium]
MAFLTVTGIVTRYTNYRENDRILTLFTREMGRVDAKARGCRRQKSPLLACAQPFVFGEYQLFSSKDRFIVDQCDIRETFYPLREDINKFTAANVMLSLSGLGVQEREPNAELFSLLYHCLSFLCYGESEPADIALCFVSRYFGAIGFRPAVTSCALCETDLRTHGELMFHAPSGGAICINCARRENIGESVSGLTLEAMRRMLLLEDADMDRVRLPHAVRQELFIILEDYCAAILERENKPLSALRALL